MAEKRIDLFSIRRKKKKTYDDDEEEKNSTDRDPHP